MKKIKFANGESFELQGYDSTTTQLNFRLYESDVNSMKEMLQDTSNTSLIQIVDVNEDATLLPYSSSPSIAILFLVLYFLVV